MKSLRITIMTVSFISIFTIHSMDRRRKGFDEDWGIKTAAVRGALAQIQVGVNHAMLREGADQTFAKIASEMQKQGETPESLRAKAQEAETQGNRVDAASYRRVATILEQQAPKEKSPHQ